MPTDLFCSSELPSNKGNQLFGTKKHSGWHLQIPIIPPYRIPRIGTSQIEHVVFMLSIHGFSVVRQPICNVVFPRHERSYDGATFLLQENFGFKTHRLVIGFSYWAQLKAFKTINPVCH